MVQVPGCTSGISSFLTGLEALAVPNGAYRFATSWLTTSMRWCMDPSLERGVILSLGVGCRQQPGAYRLIIERVEATTELGQL